MARWSLVAVACRDSYREITVAVLVSLCTEFCPRDGSRASDAGKAAYRVRPFVRGIPRVRRFGRR